MNFFISDALAQGGQAQAGGGMEFLIMIVVFFVIMYFMIIRPQTKRAKEHRQMVETLSKGDEVITGGGIIGRITEVGESFVKVEVADGVVFNVQKQSIMTVMPKGTMKDL
ncbi:MAG: preprotein translocase subunit YajC [Chromatiales bacterium]|jgi:preprotein translocase subunit YajC|nr:preprotein translocase subunit YajC [Chromatiales bacterium]MDX9768670.1 preprotein translocase subunit YajC [Ectothiorhodospiraceae bacterium]